MSERQVTIGSKVGLHARPASLFAKAVKNAGIPVKIAKNGQPPVNAASLLSLLTLGAEFGDQVTLSAEGDGADAALDELAAMLGSELDVD
ncbi:HPr family phosphocarrier protein [Pseudonocardia charpentierae]|uniref:Phosphocarrier protein HPr n=1 Tax=Pseudonocardia charpentierae TaxID=3075545 RepID=A0ABU2N7C3_9PSEU|nr:HPr family phosphocarrier protein [Pseudonocardia sp. DSM 45834]MDT0349184.1 HPr family phosphocarrier protein [Pseudonocardia sp. DSM 45834]